jgi:hypothetical protein
MEGLIHQAFLHVDVIGNHVREGHYDLIGPDGEIILPQVWETMVKPDWGITMHMWPIPEPPKHDGPPPPGHLPPGIEAMITHATHATHTTGKREKHGKKKKDRGGMGGLFGGGMPPPPPMAPPGAMMGGPPPGGIPPPPPMGAPGIMEVLPGDPGDQAASILGPERKKSKSSKKKAAGRNPLLWLAGAPSSAKQSSIKRKK